MGEMKPRLVWVAEYDDDSDYLSVMERLDTHGQYEGVTICRLHGEASADLIAEAGTVFHNTGLSPVQLVEMMKELKAALNLWLGTADNPNAGWRGAGGSDALFACEHCGKKHEDCTRLEHACDCPITLARAALAKCEGVKP